MRRSIRSNRAFRPVSAESLKELEPLKEIREEFSGPGIERSYAPSLTTISASEATIAPNTTLQDFFKPLKLVFEPLPESAQLPIELEIEGVAFMRGKRGAHSKALAAILKDPQEVLLRERLEYFERMRRPVPERPFIPHVTLFRIANNRITEDMRLWVEDRVPSLVSLGALSTTRRVSDTQPKPKTQTHQRPSEHTTIPTGPTRPIPTVSQVTIPKDAFAMLAAARRPHTEEQ